VTPAAKRSVGRRLLWIAAPVALLAVVRPWTVRPINAEKTASFDAAAFAVSAWPRLVREATETATDVADVVSSAGGSPAKARFVKGTGVVAAVDRSSRVGVIRVPVGSNAPPVAIQIGPVIRGTSLRDASSFIPFSDFTNQFDFAGAANALNDYALRAVITPTPIDTLKGLTIRFMGAAAKSSPREDGAIEIVPVQLEIVKGNAK
jgi:predicted lipoprotein